MREDELVPVYNALSEVDALLNRTMLEEAGIDVVERQLEADWLEGVRQDGLHSQLLVAVANEAEARRLLDDFTREAESGELTAEGAPDEVTDADLGNPES